MADSQKILSKPGANLFSDDPTGNAFKSNTEIGLAQGAFNIETEELMRLNKQIDFDNSDDSLF